MFRLPMLAAALLCLVIAAQGAAAAVPAEVEPVGLYRRADLERAGENAARHDWAREQVDAVIGKADAWLAMDEATFKAWVPEHTPQRLVDCPACGQDWRYVWDWSPAEPFSVTCIDCKTKFPNPKFPETTAEHVTDQKGAAQTWMVYRDAEGKQFPLAQVAGHHRMMHTAQVRELALAYAFTGDERYAEKARALLLAIAERYPGYKYHNFEGFVDQPDGWAGKFSGWRFQDATVGLDWLTAYDIIRNAPGMTAEDRTKIEKGILEEMIPILTARYRNITNADGRVLSAVAYIGRLLGRPDLVHHAIDAPFGFREVLDTKFTADGIWWEGAFSYATMMLSGMVLLPEILRDYSDPAEYAAADRYDRLDLYADARIENIYTAQNLLVMPNGRLPPTNDSHMRTALNPVLAELAVARYGARHLPALVSACSGNPEKNAPGGALVIREPGMQFEKQAAEPLPSVKFEGYGMAILRSRPSAGQPRNDLVLGLDFGPPGGGHGHYDKLNIIYYGYGRELAMDMGYLHADHPRRPWMMSSLSHNLVVVDEEQQRKTSGTLELFQSAELYEVAAASTGTAYGELEDYWRLCAVINGHGDLPPYVIDVFRVRGGTTHDWTFQVEGELGEIKGLSLESAAMPEWEENPMYRWLSEVGRAATPGNVETLWKAGKIGTRVTLLADGESTVFRATMPGQRQFEKQHDERPLDKLIVRRTPKDGAGMFIAIHEPLAEGAAPSIDSVERVGGDAATGTAVLRITRRGGIEEMVRVERSGEEPFKFTRRAGTSG